MKTIPFRRCELFVGLSLLVGAVDGVRAQGYTADHPAVIRAASAVIVKATAFEGPPKIRLEFPLNYQDEPALGYKVYRRLKGASTWALITPTQLPGTAAGVTPILFEDLNVTVGAAYEYRVERIRTSTQISWGFIYAGVKAPAVHSRGKILLIVDKTRASELAVELDCLQRDLVGDGWIVIRREFDRGLLDWDGDPPIPNIRQDRRDQIVALRTLIQDQYFQDTANVKAVYLFGHLPVAYCARVNYDGHGARSIPGDAFYAEMDSPYSTVEGPTVWSDILTSDNISSVYYPRHKDYPGDGKFDQFFVPSAIELQIGRVDLSDMPAFAPLAEDDLLRRYLNKAHNFRHKIVTYGPRALLAESAANSDFYAETAWTDVNPFFRDFDGGEQCSVFQTSANDFFDKAAAGDFTWAFVGDWGGDQGDSWLDLGGSVRFKDPVNVAFIRMYGSYLLDWGYTNSLLRAALCGSKPLASFYEFRFGGLANRGTFFHMALGETIGYGMWFRQNGFEPGSWRNLTLPPSPSPSPTQPWMNLMGDPTLRLQAVSPPKDVRTYWSGAGPLWITWQPSTEPNLSGYAIYRSGSSQGPFVRIDSGYVTGTSFADTQPSASERWYMVRAAKVETTQSGSYYNLSQGIVNDLKLTDVQFAVPAFQFQVRGPVGAVCKIETSTDLHTWVPVVTPSQVTLASGSSLVAQPIDPPYSYRFFRAKSGGDGSANAVGYVRFNAPALPGETFFTNPFRRTPDNRIAYVLNSVPNGTAVRKFNEASGTWSVANTLSGGSWSDPAMTLEPGDVMAIGGPTSLEVRLFGEVPQGTFERSVPNGSFFALKTAQLQDWNQLGFSAEDGDSAYVYDPVTFGWSEQYSYVVLDPEAGVGVWFHPFEGEVAPKVSPGSVVFYSSASAESRTWLETYGLRPLLVNPPTAPSNAALQSLANGLRLTWDDSSGGENSEESFEISRLHVQSGEWYYVTVPANTTEFLDTSVGWSQYYCYFIRAVSRRGVSGDTQACGSWFP